MTTGAAPLSLVLVLSGAFCALWAQNTKREPIAWFFIGVMFSIIAVLAVLCLNAEDLKRKAVV